MDNKENPIFYRGVGTSKTFLSTKIGLNAIQVSGLNARFYTLAELMNKLMDLSGRGILGKFYKQLEKVNLLVLDELGYIPLHKNGTELLFQMISRCYERKSLIITTNLRFSEWNHVV